MNQFRNLFNTCRIPQKNKDRLDVHFKTANEGICPTHVIIIYRNRFFKINAFNKINDVLNIAEFYSILEIITSTVKTDGIGIGALTGDYRDDWANNREYLVQLNKKNEELFFEIETSLFVCVLDENVVQEINEVNKIKL